LRYTRINTFHNNQNPKIPKEKLAKYGKIEKKKEFISFFLYPDYLLYVFHFLKSRKSYEISSDIPWTYGNIDK